MAANKISQFRVNAEEISVARGINKVILVGNCGQDPETRYTAGGNAITNLSIATSDSWKDKQTGQMQERTEWHRVVFFNRLAEIAGEYLKKGSKVYVEGKLQTRKWQDQQGQERYTTEIVASEMQMLDSRGEGQQGAGYGGANMSAPQQGASNQYGAQQGSGGYSGGQSNYSAPAQNAPAQNAPAQNAPAQNAPAQNAPAQNAPMQSPPAQNAPMQSPPVQKAPVPEMDSFDDDIPF